MDGIPFGSVTKEGVHQPFMFMTEDYNRAQDAGSYNFRGKVKSIYDLNTQNNRLWVKIKGTGHFNFSDQALLNDSHIGKLSGNLGPVDARRALAVAGTPGHSLMFI